MVASLPTPGPPPHRTGRPLHGQALAPAGAPARPAVAPGHAGAIPRQPFGIGYAGPPRHGRDCHSGPSSNSTTAAGPAITSTVPARRADRPALWRWISQ